MKMTMKLSLSFLSLAMLLSLGCTTRLKSDSSLRVGTYNIRMMEGDKKTPNAWDERKKDLADLIKELDLDVFGLQEVMPGQASYLAETLPDYAFVGEFREADRKSGEASPVCYRKSRFTEIKSGTFWLSETPEVPGRKGWGAACPRVCSWLLLEDNETKRRFCFANVHTDHVSERAREEGMLLVVERMKEFGAGVPIVFTGDHNCRENQKPAQSVSKILKNALYLSETKPEGPWRTFNAWRWFNHEVSTEEALQLPMTARNNHKSKDNFGVRIDYIYVSPGVKVLDYATHNNPRPDQQLYPSDHFPITATIQF